MQMVKIIGFLFLAALLCIVALVLIRVTPRIQLSEHVIQISTFEECVATGNPVMESYPRQCRTKAGAIFIEEIPQNNSTESGTVVSNTCAIAGCSGQLCVNADIADSLVTTCEYQAEYACYREASCEPQISGECGWTQTESLSQCLASPPEVGTEIRLEVL